jgi:Ca2+-transporting ATPase
VPGLNHDIFRLMTIKQWGEKNNIWILFSSVGFSALAPFLVLVVDSIIFFSYHYTKNPWNRNRDLVNKYVVADQNRAKKRNRKRNSNA